MTLSRHTQVENIACLLGVRRGELRRRTLRQAAYLNLVGAILGRPAAEVPLAVPISSIASVGTTLAPLPDHSQAA